MLVLANLILLMTAAIGLADSFAAPKAARAIEKRDYVSVTNDLSSLSSSISSCSRVLTSYTAGVPAAVTIQSAVQSIVGALNKSTTDTQNSQQATPAQAQVVCNYFGNNLVPVIKGVFGALLAKKAQLKAAGLTGVVNSDLSTLNASAVALATALSSKGTARSSCGSSAISVVKSLFSSASSSFNAP